MEKQHKILRLGRRSLHGAEDTVCSFVYLVSIKVVFIIGSLWRPRSIHIIVTNPLCCCPVTIYSPGTRQDLMPLRDRIDIINNVQEQFDTEFYLFILLSSKLFYLPLDIATVYKTADLIAAIGGIIIIMTI